jgi:signal transduction histidine kinase
MKGWNGEYGPVSAFPFIIRQPYWQTWWFYLLLAVLTTGFIYAFYRYRIKNLLRLQRVRNNIATDLHDDIGSTLTNINILSQLTIDKIGEPEKAQTFLERIKSEVLSSGQALDDIIWSVNSRNDSFNQTIARMRRFAADLFDNSPTKCHLALYEEADERKINMELRRDIYMIYKESMNNIHKHAYAKNVWVEVLKENNMIRLSIRDDGKGFDLLQDNSRNGLKNLKFRVEKWQGEFEFNSSIGEGTSIQVGLPLQAN